MAGGRTLVVNLIADTSKFGNQMASAKKDVGGFRGAINGLGRMAGPALAGAAAAAGALAIAFGVDGVKAALEEEQAVARLGKTLDNLGLGAAKQGVEDWIDATQRATGVADDQLRPAFSRLVTSTGDVEKAQGLLNVAMDTAQATGKPLESVVAALGKAADGSTGAISKLGLGIDATALKGMSLDQITAELSKKFGGSAATNADTYAGRIAQLSVGFDELKESFGMGFLSGLGDAEGGVDSLTTAMEDLEPTMEAVGVGIGELVTSLGTLMAAYTNTVGEIAKFRDSLDSPVAQRAFDGFASKMVGILNPVAGLHMAFMDATEAEQAFEDATQDADFKDFLGDLKELENRVRNISNVWSGINWGASNYADGPSRTPSNIENLDNQYNNRGTRSAMGIDKSGSAPQIVIQAGIGDPVAIAREVERVLRLSETRLGP